MYYIIIYIYPVAEANLRLCRCLGSCSNSETSGLAHRMTTTTRVVICDSSPFWYCFLPRTLNLAVDVAVLLLSLHESIVVLDVVVDVGATGIDLGLVMLAVLGTPPAVIGTGCQL